MTDEQGERGGGVQVMVYWWCSPYFWVFRDTEAFVPQKGARIKVSHE
jgi:hypothetical protein